MRLIGFFVLFILVLVPLTAQAQGDCQSYSEVQVWFDAEGTLINFNLEEPFRIKIEAELIGSIRAEDDYTTSGFGIKLLERVVDPANQNQEIYADVATDLDFDSYALFDTRLLDTGKYTIAMWPSIERTILVRLRIIFVDPADGYRSISLRGHTLPSMDGRAPIEHSFDLQPGMMRAKIEYGAEDITCMVFDETTQELVTSFSEVGKVWQFPLEANYDALTNKVVNWYYLSCESSSSEAEIYRVKLSLRPDNDMCDTIEPQLDEIIGVDQE